MANSNHPRSRKTFIPILAVLLLLSISCSLLGGSTQNGDNTNPPLVDDTGGTGTTVDDGTVSGDGTGLTIQLSEGRPQDQAVEPVPVAEGTPLTNEEIAAILARLPEMPYKPEEQVEFKLPGDPIPPPRPGETIDLPFPVPPETVGPGTVESGPLEVLRYAPEGEIPIAPFVNVTFNQPMVPLGTLSQLAAEDVPVKIEPALEGTWKWVGTRTISFEYDSELIDRLPMATEFTVTIPAGTKSATGATLANAVTWTFSTPPPKLISSYPYDYDPQPLEPVFFLAFDQRIDPQTIVEHLTTTADGKAFSIRLVSQEMIGTDDTLSESTKEQLNNLIEASAESRWLAFKSADPLPKDSEILVVVEPGAPSAEGPLVTKESQSYSFRTYAPLKIVESGCSWYSEECYPLSPFYIRFNNPLDEDLYEDSMISIDPAILGASVSIIGNTINISGATEGRTTYRVTVDAGLTDIFGQTLGRDEKLTFKVGKAEPVLIGPENIFVTLDPSAAKPTLSLYAINYSNLDVRIYSVEPSDWQDFKIYLQEYYRTDQPPSPPGQLVLDESMAIDVPNDVLTEVGIDLSRVMDGDYGHFIVIVKPPKAFFAEENIWQTVQVWVQVTQIGLDAFSDHSEMVAWATSLQDGSPLEGVSIQSSNGNLEVATDKEGIARFDLTGNSILYLTAQKGKDISMLPRSQYAWGDEGWSSYTVRDNLRWYVFDDRAMYRPGEEVHIKGWMRLVGADQYGDVGLVGDRVQSIYYQVVGPQGNQLGAGSAEVNNLGSFDFVFTIPESVNLGYAQMYINATGNLGNVDSSQYTHSFQIQEFRRPEFEVKARNETTAPYFAGGNAIVAVEAAYYAGGPLPNAEVTWTVTSTPTNYQPPNWDDFNFGTWTPWWWFGYYWEDGGGYNSNSTSGTFSGSTDATGNHYLRMDFELNGEPRPYSVTAQAVVMDVNRQAWAGTTSLLVHSADLYVGMRSERYFVERGTPLEIDLIVTDLDGNAVAGRSITVTAARLEWKYQKGNWREVAVDEQECLQTSADEPVSCTFETPLGGRYQITAVVTDDSGRRNQSQLTRWVSGGQLPPSRKVELQTAELIPDKETYQPGDTARILVQSPFSPAEGLLTVSRGGILYTERFTIEEDTTTLEIPITEAHYPNLNIQVDLVGAAPRTDNYGEIVEDAPLRPAYASNQLDLSIPALARVLTVEASPRRTELSPGEQTTIDVVLKDAAGEAVPEAELAVVVVDEAILALTNYQLVDPISVFYYTRYAELNSVYSRSSIILVDPMSLAQQTQEAMATQALEVNKDDSMDMAVPEATEGPVAEEASRAAGGVEGEASQTPIQVRTDFNPLAVFATDVRTDASGKASVKVKLPDNLTRYRVMVVAVDESGRQFGTGAANLTARLPLMVRPSASRFLNFGDQFEMPVVLQNQTDEAITVDVVAEVFNLELTEGSGMRVTVPARDRIEVRFPGTTISAGTAYVRFAGVSGEDADAAMVSLPVYTPATTEAFATYGVVDEGAVLQPIASPEGVFPQYGGLEITTSSTALQALTDAVLYLVSYPFDCSEQIASRILGVSALRDVLSAFEADGLPSPEEMEAAVVRDIAELQKLQNYDGGFPYWRRGWDSIPFNTVHVAHALARARMMGFEVPQEMWQSVQTYLTYIEDYYPYWYSLRLRQTISAYALYVRNLMDDPDPVKANSLLQDAGLEQLSLEAVAWIWQVLVNQPGYEDQLTAIRRHVNNQSVETAGAANFFTGYDDDTYLLLHSNRRTDAVLLDALVADSPDSDLIPKVVNGLLAHRTKGRWYNTQENVFVLLALDRYFDTYESQEPDFVARIWLGEDYAGSSQFQGYTTERQQIDIPMSYLIGMMDGQDQQDLIISKEGVGRLYYRLGLRYSPTDLRLDPIDMGFVVTRSYEGVDDVEDVYQDPDGVWHIKAGARVRVRITMVADDRRYHVALVDPLPAGLEIINPDLAVSEAVPADPNSQDRSWWWWWPWYEHQNMRDERAEAFTSLLWDGVYEFTYVTRATMPGTFVAPPAKAEEMYSPEVFGRSSSDTVIVE